MNALHAISPGRPSPDRSPGTESAAPFRFTLGVATDEDRDAIAAARHEVYARELRQHETNAEGTLRDRLDGWSVPLVARIGGMLAGFVFLTPPGHPAFSIDKYFERDSLPFPVDDRTFEVRLLTVLPPFRGGDLALLLMYAAWRWVESHGGSRIVAIGRREVMDLYVRAGLRPLGRTCRSGEVTFELMLAEASALRERADSLAGPLARLEARVDWQLPFAFRRPAACFHGGAFFEAVGEGFDRLSRRHGIVGADVLDAWFDPAPGVLRSLASDLAWMLSTSPPTSCAGLVGAIATARGVPADAVLPGAGSSDLIFRAFRHWLTPHSRVLLLDPTYGEYAHVLERVIGCRVDRLPLDASRHWDVPLRRLASRLGHGYDLVVLVNPNSPTGRHVPRGTLERMLARVPADTRVWVDETYVDYAGEDQSLERFAARSENVVVCKSMSKVYALSGARVAYLCAGPHQLESLRAITPPWVVSLPAQVAAVRALEDPAYYARRWRETHVLRDQLARGLEALGWTVVPGVANFLLCTLPAEGPDAASVVRACRERGVFLRDAASMSPSLGDRSIRVAVQDAATQERVLAAIREVRGPGQAPPARPTMSPTADDVPGAIADAAHAGSRGTNGRGSGFATRHACALLLATLLGLAGASSARAGDTRIQVGMGARALAGGNGMDLSSAPAAGIDLGVHLVRVHGGPGLRAQYVNYSLRSEEYRTGGETIQIFGFSWTPSGTATFENSLSMFLIGPNWTFPAGRGHRELYLLAGSGIASATRSGAYYGDGAEPGRSRIKALAIGGAISNPIGNRGYTLELGSEYTISESATYWGSPAVSGDLANGYSVRTQRAPVGGVVLRIGLGFNPSGRAD